MMRFAAAAPDATPYPRVMRSARGARKKCAGAVDDRHVDKFAFEGESADPGLVGFIGGRDQATCPLEFLW
ncbi:hypothetical protein D3C87_1905840 [compost metagenome]